WPSSCYCQQKDITIQKALNFLLMIKFSNGVNDVIEFRFS
ncbi:hypothetical protein ECEC1737_3660, partial [Escherichia coli EC1737]